ncbi:MAG TPA: dTDP-glucose 4,6-dehydratase [Candidatus Xenobia bacterium]|nr:dTDP-glucose 4,6-dehydratase [Candidatus Xenobia bacterium]
MRLLVTGGAGFIGSNFIRYLLTEHAEVHVTNLDALTYAGNLENLADLAANPRYRFVRGDVADAGLLEDLLRGLDAVIHFAAETHVDRSIESAEPFLRTNVLGTQVLIEAARRQGIPRFIHISTDEVYGSAAEGVSFAEDAPLKPSSPYAASKAAADLLVLSYVRTYGFPAVILRCSNNFGPYQFPEKLIPLMIANALEDKALPVYGDGLNVRDWIYVEDHCRAIWRALVKGRTGEIYNIGGVAQKTNLEIVRALLRLLGKSESLITFVADRPGHDRRYALNSSKLRAELGWTPCHTFEDALERTVAWYRSHPEWLARCRSGAYRDYYQRHYENREKLLATLRSEGA